MEEKYKIENDFLIFPDGKQIHIPTLEMICGLNHFNSGGYPNIQSGKGNTNIIIGGKNNKVTVEGGISNTNG